MRILLMGEYSGLHTCLSQGLSDVLVDTASTGDGFKGFARKFDLSGGAGSRFLRTIRRLVKELRFVSKVGNYDVIQLINPLVFCRFGPATLLVETLLKRANRSFLLAAGDDSYYWKAYRNGLYSVSPHHDILLYDRMTETSIWERKRLCRLNDKVVAKVTGVIPAAVDYEIAYAKCKKVLRRIDFPINVDEWQYVKPLEAEKLIIYHGVQRGKEGFKGTRHIDAALRRVEAERRDVEVIRTETIPLSEYRAHIARSHVVADQANSYCPGMAALFAMATGRVVLSGAKPEYLAGMGITECPIVNIYPDAEQIHRQIINLADNRAGIVRRGIASREYILRFHHYRKISERYVQTWQSVGLKHC